MAAPQVDPYGLPAAQTAAVTRGQTSTVDFLYEFTGTVEGTVRNSTGTALSGIQVCDERGNCATTNASGFYTFHTPEGTRTIVPQRFIVGYSVEQHHNYYIPFICSGLAYLVAAGVIHALMHVSNDRSRALSKRIAHEIRRYALFERRVREI